MLPADVPAEYAPAMVAACSGAVTEGSCAMAATLTESTRPDAIALVLWQGEGFLRVTVRVGRGNGQWVQRALAFSERDSITERFTTVGLTVATLVGETAPKQAEPAPSPAPVALALPAVAAPVVTPPRDAPPKPSLPTQSPRSPLLLAQVGVMTSSSWRDADWQRGGWLSVGVRLPHSPFVLQGFGSYAVGSGPSYEQSELETRAVEGGVRAGVTGTWNALDLGGAALIEVGLRHLQVQGGTVNQSDTEAPVRLRAVGTFPARGPVGALLGAALRIPTTSSDATDDFLTRPDLETELVAGVEVRL
jgi:hypothetical protein